MAAPAILTQGTTFSIDDVGGSTPVVIAGVKSISGLGSSSAAEIDVTTLASTYKEFRMGIPDFGQFTLNFNFNLDDAGQAEMKTKMEAQLPALIIITFPATNPTVTLNVCTITAYILNMQADASSDGVMSGSSTFRVTGAPAWT